MYLNRRIVIIFGLLAFAGGALWVLRQPLRMMTTRPARVGERLPAFMAATLDGQRVQINPTGKKTLFVFFKVDCPHCHHQLDNLERLSHTARASGLQIIGLSRTDQTATIAMLTEHRYSFPIFLDQSNAMIGRLGRVMVPTLALVDQQGIIRYIRSGYREFEFDEKLFKEFAVIRQEPGMALVEETPPHGTLEHLQ